MARVWMGRLPIECDGCHIDVAKLNAFSDIKTKHGPWGIFCDECVPKYSIGRTIHYGLGLGQKWSRQSDGKFSKTQG